MVKKIKPCGGLDVAVKAIFSYEYNKFETVDMQNDSEFGCLVGKNTPCRNSRDSSPVRTLSHGKHAHI
jgi:hypothetical protein